MPRRLITDESPSEPVVRTVEAGAEDAAPSSWSANLQYAQLREEIVSGRLPPGAALHEVAVSSRLGVSRAPIRDALLRLEADGLVERGPRGTTVRHRTADDVFAIYQARIVLEGEAAASAARRASDIDIARLAYLHEDAKAEADHAAARVLHARWHRVLAAAGHNPTIIELLDRLVLQLAPYETPSLAAAPNLSQSHGEHDEVLAAIRAGDGELARRLVSTHLERTRDVRVGALLRSER